MNKTFTNRVLGSYVAVTNTAEQASLLVEQLNKLKGQYIVLSQVDDLLLAMGNGNVRTFLYDAALVLPVGEPIAWIERLRGFKSAEAVREEELYILLKEEACKGTLKLSLIDYKELKTEQDVTSSLREKLLEEKCDVIWLTECSLEENDVTFYRQLAQNNSCLVLISHKKLEKVGAKVHAVSNQTVGSFLKNNLRFLMQSIPDAWKWQKKDPNEKKDLLIYAHYYYPDVASTGQILTELAEGLKATFHTTVICTVPSYTGQIDKHYRRHKYYYENINGVDVLRIRVPEFRKNFSISRIINIVSYFFSAIIATRRVGHQDYVFTISQPPVLGGLLGVFGKYLKHAKFIYNIQDFNPEQVMAVSFTSNPLILNTMMLLDKFSCRQADELIVVGRDMVDTLKNRFPIEMPRYAHINNWINEQEIIPLDSNNERVRNFREKYGLLDKFVIMYSGNIGLYYDLLEIEKLFDQYKEEKDVVFAFVGQGTVLEDMQAYKEAHQLDNLVFIPYQDKRDLVYSLNAGDVHFVMNAKGIKGVSVPSKLYGVMAAGKPVLGILEEGAEARLIVEEASCGMIAEPGDYEAIRNTIDYFIANRGSDELQKMGQNGRTFLECNLTRNVSIQKYADQIVAL